MKAAILALGLVLLLVQEGKAVVKCVQGDGSDTTAQTKDCTDTEVTKCNQPKFIEYTGVMSGTYSCGACPDNSPGCEDCVGNANTACNVPKTKGEDFNCHTYALNEDKTAFTKTGTFTCKRLDSTPIKCNMPGSVFDKDYVVPNSGCGECTAEAKAANKCADCDTAECNVMASPIKCIQGDGTDMTAKDCLPANGEAAPTKCRQTKFVEYTGLAGDLNYGCGACKAGSEDKCQDCDGSASDACNKKIETDESFKCYDYEVKDEKFVKKADAVTCQRKKDTPIKCNMPGTAADKTYSVKNKGCGGCVDQDKTDKKCAECDKAECNIYSSAFAITSFLLPLLATLFSLV